MKHATGGTATTKNAEVKILQLTNGISAPLLVNDFMDNIQLAVISQNVLAKLIRLLPSANIYDIISTHINKLNKMSEPSMEKFVDILKDELEFHSSVNLIKGFLFEESAPKPEPEPIVADYGSTH